MEDSNSRLKDHIASSTRKIKELDEKLLAAENLCAKFLESGRYWRQERNAKSKLMTQTSTNSKIVMPMSLQGGGKKLPGSPTNAASTTNGGTGVLPNSPMAVGTAGGAAGGAGGSNFSSPQQPSNGSSSSSSSSRLSVGLASGARSAITSITSAISGKPKPSADSMASFF